MVSEIAPVDFEFTLVVHMYELVSERGLHMLLVEKVARAHDNATDVGKKTSCMSHIARRALDVRLWDGAAREGQVLHHEYHNRAWQVMTDECTSSLVHNREQMR